MEEKDIDLIERYFRNKLNAVETADLERRADSDPFLRQEIELHQKALQAIRLQEKADVLAMLSQKGKELDQQKNARKRWRLLVAGLVIVTLLWGWWQWNAFSLPLRTSNPSIILENEKLKQVPPGNVPQISPKEDIQKDEAPQKNVPMTLSKDGRERLFAANFRPYKDETLEPVVRGNSSPSATETFQQFYWDSQYQAALSHFEKLSNLAKTNDNNLFLKAECLLAIGKSEEAIPILTEIKKNDRTRFMPTVSWHLALAYLHSGKLKQAKKQLQVVRSDGASQWQSDAADLLKTIQ